MYRGYGFEGRKNDLIGGRALDIFKRLAKLPGGYLKITFQHQSRVGGRIQSSVFGNPNYCMNFSVEVGRGFETCDNHLDIATATTQENPSLLFGDIQSC